MENAINPKPRLQIAVIVVLMIASVSIGGIVGYVFSATNLSSSIDELSLQLSSYKNQLEELQNSKSITSISNNVINDNSESDRHDDQALSFSELYEKVYNSVVVVEGFTVSSNMFGRAVYSSVQGSGFVYNYSGQIVVLTNNHVVDGVVNITITFANGNAYSAEVLGADGYADLAVLSVDAPDCEYCPLEIISSSTLNVGDTLVAVGGPYGLAGTMTSGIVSALNRTITEDMSGSYPIADVIQTSTPINSGNSGGPLFNANGEVVGITTAIVSNSDGLGFAIPSDTILREIEVLITQGSYNDHPVIGAYGVDMNYQIAQAMETNITYGWLITHITSKGPADDATLKGGDTNIIVGSTTTTIGGDIIVAINGSRIRNIDDLSTYLERNTLPEETVTVTIIRNNQMLDLSLTLCSRPALS
ncbi:MAG: PDZ domain-containing protein [Crenarchaeota archaeon]|nr:PDZ domain-containing protein [Thermoproteota archaeon]